MYDITIVGAGLFGATVASRLSDEGMKVLVIDKRKHIAGNCYTKVMNGIDVHMYGPHIFHTSNEKVWSFVNKFSDFNNFVNKIKSNVGNKFYSLPFNMNTFNQVWGVTTEEEARKKIEEDLVYVDGDDFESVALRTVGKTLYKMFLAGYTSKQWNRNPKEIPGSIFKRFKFRFTWDEDYYSDSFQGIPTIGYAEMIWNMLRKSDVELNIDFKNTSRLINRISKKVLYTGPLDELFNHEFGYLEYRSLNFDHKIIQKKNFQNCSIINYPDNLVDCTRSIEHKHFMQDKHLDNETTIVTYEYPADYSVYSKNEQYYPINDEKNNLLHSKYLNFFKNFYGKNHFVGGRLGLYEYMDMNIAIEKAFQVSEEIVKSNG